MNQTALVAPNLVAFLPWLRLKEPQTIGGFDFTPYRDREVRPNFSAVSKELELIFSSYVDRNGNQISSPVIVTSPEGNWSRSDDDFSNVAWAARLLFLASWSANRYFEHFGYVGSVPFRPVWQRFTGSSFIGLAAKRRDGTRQDGGYEHGKIKFDIPLQCVLEDADVDSRFLQALNAANASAASVTIERLKNSLSFVALANTDDELMDHTAEAILMGSAFEQLFGIQGQSKKRQLRDAFGEMFGPCGNVTAEAAHATPARSGITFEAQYEAAQRQWWLHKTWMNELYELRSELAHEGAVAAGGAWTPFEHLLIAAFVFPLIVKKMLAEEGSYALTEEDEVKCVSIDRLLLAPSWNGNDENTSWRRILEAERERRSRARLDAKLAELFAPAAGESSPTSPEDSS
jgi:hypothetical protein